MQDLHLPNHPIPELAALDLLRAFDGGAVLPGFTLPVKDWVERAGKREKGK